MPTSDHIDKVLELIDEVLDVGNQHTTPEHYGHPSPELDGLARAVTESGVEYWEWQVPVPVFTQEMVERAITRDIECLIWAGEFTYSNGARTGSIVRVEDASNT